MTKLLTLLIAVAVIAVNAEQLKSPEEDPTACAVLLVKRLDFKKLESDNMFDLLEIADVMSSQQKSNANIILNHLYTEDSFKLRVWNRSILFTKLAVIYNKIGNKDKALEVLSRTEKNFYDTYDLGNISVAYGEIGELDKAYEIAEKIEFFKRNSYQSIFCVTRMIVKKHRKEKALQWLAEATRKTRNVERDGFKAFALADIVYNYIQIGELETALKLADEISDAEDYPWGDEERWGSVRFKIRAFIYLANKYTELNQHKAAEEMLMKADKIAKGIKHSHLGPELRKDIAVTMAGAGKYRGRTVICFMCRFKENPLSPNADRGIAIARDMKHPLQKAITLHLIALKYSDSGFKKKAATVLEEARKVTENIKKGSEYYSIGGLGFANCGKYDVLVDIISGLAEVGEFDTACKLAKHLPFDGLKDKALLNISSEYLKLGEKEKALAILHKISNLTAYQEEKLCLLYAKAGEYNKAVEKAMKIERKYRKSDVLRKIAIIASEAGNNEEAIKIASKIEWLPNQALALAIIGNHYPKPGEEISDKSKEILRQIIKQAEDKNKEKKK